MRRNTRRFTEMDKNIKLCDQYCLCYIELYEAQLPPVQMDKNITSILILWLVLFMLNRTVLGATPASSDG